MPVEVLCGPVLRRVTPDAVTVFLALRSSARVTLRVYAGEDATARGTGLKLVGSHDTVALGARLHVVAVTAGGDAANRLTPGQTYRYQVHFGAPGGAGDVPETGPSLFSPGYLTEPGSAEAAAYPLLGYGGEGKRLPSFELAPDDPGLLRVLHVADRLPQAEGPDALAFADERVAAAVGGDGSTRPHLLLMTGDQVHADRVSPTLLAVLRTAVADLGVPDDALPGGAALPGPGKRWPLTAEARFATPTDSHLLTFAEYAAAHLLAWSPALWPAALPGFEAVHPDRGWTALPEATRTAVELGAPYALPGGAGAVVDDYIRWTGDSAALEEFRASLTAVRRALANVPVLTSPGDHEVSGGWNGPARTAKAMLGTPLGRRVVGNGLAAHAVFQHWGNAPEQFEGTAAGATLLAKLKAWLPGAPASAPAADAVAAAAGLPSAALVRPAAALTYHHLLSRPRWQVLVLDTQTQRGYAVAAEPSPPDTAPPAPPDTDPPSPVADAALDGALGTLPAATADMLTIVVSHTPLVRTPPHDAAETQAGTWSWSSATKAMHRFMGKLTTRGVPAGTDDVRRRRLVLLSGGQGHGYATRVRYSADKPYGGGDKAVEAVVAHLVAGPARHTTPLGKRLHHDGYRQRTVATPWREHVGWDLDLSKAMPKDVYTIGLHFTDAEGGTAPWQAHGRPQLAAHEGDRRLDARPQWRFHVDYRRTDLVVEGPQRPGTPLPIDPLLQLDVDGTDVHQPGPVPVWGLSPFTAAARNAVANRDLWAAGTEVVGENALSELTFGMGIDGPLEVRDTRWWRLPGKETQPLTRFTIPVDPGLSRYHVERYDGRALRRDDRDSAGGGKARYEGVEQVAGTLVADLQNDLAKLGFVVVRADTPGRFGPHTEWAVREFQIHARSTTLAQEREYATGAAVPVRHVDKLQAVTVPDEHLYRTRDGLSGVVNQRTRELIGVWLANRWRCPVVIEALRLSGGVPVQPANGDHANIWLSSQPGDGTPRVFVTDFTGRYPRLHTYPQPAPAVAPPAGTPALPELVLLGQWVNFGANGFNGPKTIPRFDQVWRPETEIVPERLLPGGPTLAALVADAQADRPGARARLSTYKVIRAVAESETLGYYDALNSYDNAFLSFGTCHWTAGPVMRQQAVAREDWVVQRGELWAFLALLRHRHPEEFEHYFGYYGFGMSDDWTSATMWDRRGHKYTARPTLPTDANPASIRPRLADYAYINTWHNYYRFLMAMRGSAVIQQLMWPATRQRMADSMSTKWTGVGPEAVPNVSTERADRRPSIFEVFTSERAVAFLHRWHILEPRGVAGDGEPGWQVLRAVAYAREGRCDHPECVAGSRTTLPQRPWTGTSPNFATPPDTWTDAHEAALLAGLAHRAAYHSSEEMATTIPQVNNWPSWTNSAGGAITEANPIGFALPLNDLPADERGLKSARNTFHFDADDLPWGGPHRLEETP